MIFSPRNFYVRSVWLLIIFAVVTFAATFFVLGQLASFIIPFLPQWWETVVLLLLGTAWLLMAVYQTRKKLPPGLNAAGPIHKVPADSVKFLRDLTYTDNLGRHTHDQQIIDEVLQIIRQATSFIVIDIFLFNSFPGRAKHTLRPIAQEITQALIAKKQALPELTITFITDPINTVYGGYVSPELNQLSASGIDVITTNLNPLRDSNPIYSGLWRSVLRWIKPFLVLPRLPHPLDFSRATVGLAYYLAAFNAKANHRKVVVADMVTSQGQPKIVSLVTSANFHDGSAAHSNVALKITDRIYEDIVASEQAVAELSGSTLSPLPNTTADASGPLQVQMLTEGKIRQAILRTIRQSNPGDQIDIVMFALADRRVISALLHAAAREVKIRLILDPNNEAFGYAKTGLPNQPVAWELQRRSKGRIQIRWYVTHGEQCHSKYMLVRHDQQWHLLIGSANFTRRNLHNYNLELNVLLTGDLTLPALQAAQDYFEMIWTNRDNNIYTLAKQMTNWTTPLRFAQYWFQEVTGISAN